MQLDRLKIGLISFLFLCLSFSCFAQIEPQKLFSSHQDFCQVLSGTTTQKASFAFSLRKVCSTYSGPAIRLRNGTTSAVKDIYFDGTGLVDTTAISSFLGAASGFVTIWYDQSGQGRNATQTSASSQPQLVLASLGTKPTISFNGSQFLAINQSIYALTSNNANPSAVNADFNDGTLFLLAKTTSSNGNMAFGRTGGGNVGRWTSHLNWTDGNLYFDLGECCSATRSFSNTASVNVFRLYSFIRASTTSTARVLSSNSLVASGTGSPPASSQPTNSGQFYIGWAWNTGAAGFQGNMPEFMMFPVGLSGTNLTDIENNIRSYWAIP